jgi:hypothetical protein
MSKDKFTNALAKESSPYLLQHAHNPVDWLPWSPDILAKAQKADKPILVSIGYSTCHWCHVMEKESFEDEMVAKYMNDHFINVKIDREERPDLDDIYMEAVQSLTGSGGWPLNCFLLPDGRPFYGGTYFPPQPRHRLPSWMQLLQYIHKVYHEDRDKVEIQAERLTNAIKSRHKRFTGEKLSITAEDGQEHWWEKAYDRISPQADRQYGGFGSAPKFPSLIILNELPERKEEVYQNLVEHAYFTLDSILSAGIYDQIGGGLARYATDRAWNIPHFEKMLYDNAQFIHFLARAYRSSGKTRYAFYLDHTLRYLREEMFNHDSGLYYAAQDADSEGEEGKFYVWSWDEWRSLKSSIPSAEDKFEITKEGNWEDGKNIIWWNDSEGAKELWDNRDRTSWRAFGKDLELLKRIRSERIPPGLDFKQILSWNALLAWNLAEAHLAAPSLVPFSYAQDLIKNIIATFKRNKGLPYRIFSNGKTYGLATLTDLAFTIRACISAHQVCQNKELLTVAIEFTDLAIKHYRDDSDGFFYEAASEDKHTPIRAKQLYDQTMPSGNAVMAENLYILSHVLDKSEWAAAADGMLSKMYKSATSYPLTFSYWLKIGGDMEKGLREVVILGEEATNKLRELQDTVYLANTLYFTCERESESLPITKGRENDGQTLL